jgi:hypothetical protein
MKTGRQPLEGYIPYFARNRDETDIAYQQGWDDARAENFPPVPFQKETLQRDYYAGQLAAFNTGQRSGKSD